MQALLAATVRDLKEEIPRLGEVVTFDVKHMYAWVKENNWRTYVPERYDKSNILPGDPDCRLGVKRSTNQEQADGSTEEKKELIWGYGTGVAVSTIADYGSVVLADYTQPFNEGDITYFRPLYQQTVVALEQFPTYLAADGAYDAWYAYSAAARHGGIAAVPLNSHSKTPRDAVPRCELGLRMSATIQFNHTRLLPRSAFPMPSALSREDRSHLPTRTICQRQKLRQRGQLGIGGIQRVTLDRDEPLFHAPYNQRTGCERINARAKELGIERPRVRNRRSVANLNKLIYVIITVRALSRAKSINRRLLPLHELHPSTGATHSWRESTLLRKSFPCGSKKGRQNPPSIFGMGLSLPPLDLDVLSHLAKWHLRLSGLGQAVAGSPEHLADP